MLRWAVSGSVTLPAWVSSMLRWAVSGVLRSQRKCLVCLDELFQVCYAPSVSVYYAWMRCFRCVTLPAWVSIMLRWAVSGVLRSQAECLVCLDEPVSGVLRSQRECLVCLDELFQVCYVPAWVSIMLRWAVSGVLRSQRECLVCLDELFQVCYAPSVSV